MKVRLDFSFEINNKTIDKFLDNSARPATF